MILIDTSVWIDHLNHGLPRVEALLVQNDVLLHPFVLGELVMGTLRNRAGTLRLLRRLPVLLPARDSEVMGLIERHRIFGTGLGYVDAHLLAAARVRPDTQLLTRDRRLAGAAARIGLDLA